MALPAMGGNTLQASTTPMGAGAGGNPQQPGMGTSPQTGGLEPMLGGNPQTGGGMSVSPAPMTGGLEPMLGGNPQQPMGGGAGTPGFGPMPPGSPVTPPASPPNTVGQSMGGSMAGPGGAQPQTGSMGNWQTNPSNNNAFNSPGYQYGLQGDQGHIQDSVGLDTSKINAQGMPVSSVGQGERYRADMQDAYMNQAKSRLDPRFQQQEAAMNTRLANMGLTAGSDAWKAAQQALSFERNDAYGSATNQAILNSGSEAQRMQGMDIASGNFANNAAQQNFNNQGTSQDRQNAAILSQGKFGNEAQAQRFGQQMSQAQLNNQAVGTKEGFQTQRDISAANRASQEAQSAAQIGLGQGQLDLSRQQADFNNARAMRFDPITEQNMLMQGMSPDMNMQFGNTSVPQLPGYQSAWQQQQGQNQQNASDYSNLFSMGGDLLSRYGGNFF